MLWPRLGDDVQPVHGGVRERLHTARGPANEHAVHLRGLAQAEVEPAVVLARESGAPVHNLELARPARDEEHLRPDGAAVRARAHELERDPVVARRNAVLVDQRRLALVRDHDVEHTAIEQIRQRSEEHTSELQSLAYLVCRLLLEKKKNRINMLLHSVSLHPLLRQYMVYAAPQDLSTSVDLHRYERVQAARPPLSELPHYVSPLAI